MADPTRSLAFGVRWTALLVEEVVRAPWTIRKARRAITELPDRLDALTEALERTASVIDSSLPGVDHRLDAVGESVERLDGSVTELSNALLGMLGSIPGVRRTLRSPQTQR